jgi:hypothetical protein
MEWQVSDGSKQKRESVRVEEESEKVSSAMCARAQVKESVRESF